MAVEYLFGMRIPKLPLSLIYRYPSRDLENSEYLCGCAQHTHTLYGCAHSVQRGCRRLLHKECAVSVRAEKYQVSGVRKFVQIKSLNYIDTFETKTPKCVLWSIIQILQPI